MSEAILASWRLDPAFVFILALAAWLYVRGWRKMRAQAPWRYTPERLASFVAGLAALFVALASPLDAFGSFLLEAHMVQHLLLIMIAPPLLLLGQPVVPFMRGLPLPVMKDALGPFFRTRGLRRFGRLITNPAFTWSAMTATIVFWHMPRWYDLALRSTAWHRAEHACFIYAAILFWWPVVGVWPGKPQWSRWLMIPYLVLADMVNSAVAAWLVFASHVVYGTYAAAPRLGGITALDDQSTAGAIMWVPGSIVYLIPAFLIVMQALNAMHGERQDGSDPFPILQRVPRRQPFVERINRIARLRYFRPALQFVFLLLAIAIVVDGFRGPQIAPMNLAGLLPWTYWRGFVVLALLCAGNLFCMACPFTLPRRLARRLLPAGRPWPRRLRNKWIAAGLLLAYLWAYEVFRLWSSPWLTAWIVVGYFATACVVDSFFAGDSFCKYVCPIGQFNFINSMVSPLEVKVREAKVCNSCTTHDCVRGNAASPGCGMKLFAATKTSNFDCTFCLECIHACPSGNVGIFPVLPGSALITSRPRRMDLAVLVWALTLGAIVNAALMVDPVMAIMHRWHAWPVATVAYLAALAAALLLSWHRSARSYAFALIPLGFGMWLAHFGYHLAVGWGAILPVITRAVQPGAMTPSWISGAQMAVLDVGLLLSLYVAWRTSRRSIGRVLPWALAALMIYGAAVWIVFQPMEMRGMVM